MPDAKDLLEETEQSVRALLFSRERGAVEGVPEEIQLLYRRLVRNSLTGTIKNAVPIAARLLGDEETDALIARYLEEAPPQSRFLRDVPMELRDWVLALDEAPHHPAFPELVNWEVTELEVLYAPDPDSTRRALPERPAPSSTVEFHPSARLFAFMFPVHTLKKGASKWPKPSAQPTFVLAHRAGEQMKWVSLPVAVAKVLMLAGEGAVLAAVFETLRAEHGAEFDEAFARSWLVNLHMRGAVLGFPEE